MLQGKLTGNLHFAALNSHALEYDKPTSTFNSEWNKSMLSRSLSKLKGPSIPWIAGTSVLEPWVFNFPIPAKCILVETHFTIVLRCIWKETITLFLKNVYSRQDYTKLKRKWFSIILWYIRRQVQSVWNWDATPHNVALPREMIQPAFHMLRKVRLEAREKKWCPLCTALISLQAETAAPRMLGMLCMEQHQEMLHFAPNQPSSNTRILKLIFVEQRSPQSLTKRILQILERTIVCLHII